MFLPALGFALCIMFAAFRVMSNPVAHNVDSDVYLMGASAVQHGSSPYDATTHDLHFTYPPFAAAMFIPLTWLDLSVARAVFLVGSVICLAVTVAVISRSVKLGSVGAGFFLLGAAVTEPVYRTLMLGQINLLLMMLVLLDALVVSPRHRGWLIGIAAGIKIIPASFVFYFILQRDWRSAGRAALGGVLTVSLGGLLAPEAKWRYWTGGFLGLGRFGEDAVIGSDNQSFLGVLMRIQKSVFEPQWVVGLLCLAGVAIGVVVSHRMLRRNDKPAALLVLAVGSLLGSPISWSHHWVWMILGLAVLGARRWWISTLVLGGVFIVAPFWLVPFGSYQELLYSPSQQALSTLYVVSGVALLVRLSMGDRRQRHEQPEVEHPAGAERSFNAGSAASHSA